MTTLYATRQANSWANTSTILRDKNGHTKKIISGLLQPRKGTPTTTVNGEIFLIDWSKCEKLKTRNL